ncbi:hypothetical protein [Limisphaera sp. 4302-co]|uniref:hypothetical protein n=1 Tax=Limisphaera sp. 4302-co TaxID=3400417 RepID=UPI003C2A9409
MSDPLFPSGPWTGFYNYRPGDRHRMDLELTFRDGRIEGTGVDDVGRFVIRGRYDRDALECWWTKTYVGGHDVFYRGFREGRGIWGTWEITALDRGGFHIWPREEGEAHVREEETARALPGGDEVRILLPGAGDPGQGLQGAGGPDRGQPMARARLFHQRSYSSLTGQDHLCWPV